MENPKNLKSVNNLVKEESLDNMKIYFRTSILLRTDNSLTEDFRKASSDLKRTLYGVGVVDLNENNAVRFTMCQLEDVVSRLYIDKKFDYECKKMLNI